MELCPKGAHGAVKPAVVEPRDSNALRPTQNPLIVSPLTHFSPINSPPVKRPIDIHPSTAHDRPLPAHHDSEDATAETADGADDLIALAQHREVEEVGTAD